MESIKTGQNTGFIAQEPRPTDFIAGAETGITLSFQNNTADWRPYLPTDERQNITGIFESDACVTFSHTNTLEIEGDYAMKYGMWPSEHVIWLKNNGYIDANGHLNFSDRFTAKMSGTTQAQGNTMVNVADSARKDGLLPEASWPYPTDAIKADPANAWAVYYAEIPQSLKDIAKEFLNHFQIQYEWVAWPGKVTTMQGFQGELVKAPLQIATAVCNGWNSAPVIPACGAGTQHATTMTAVLLGTMYYIYDHYVPFQKQFSSDYVITYGFRILLSPKIAPLPSPTFSYIYSINLSFGMPAGKEVEALQKGLQTIKDKNGNPYLRVGLFGPYGPQTKDAVARFQADHGITDPNPGEHFGPKTRATLTTALVG